MQQADRPEAGRSGADSRAGRPAQTHDLAARLLRLPAGHPSGDCAAPEPASDARGHSGAEPSVRPDADQPERENWWQRGPGPDEPGTADGPEPGEPEGGPDDGEESAGDEDDEAADDDRRAGRKASGWLGERGGRAAGGATASRGPYRPWFTGDPGQPWFASGPDGLLPEPDDHDASRDGPTPGG
ncbi:MAG TPA: hypothetical protein VEL03_03000 [Streptosporangiaceae bacterium]|nr:hypothetical protein [Streptosporangiaceae bacterium]